MKEFDEKSLKV